MYPDILTLRSFAAPIEDVVSVAGWKAKPITDNGELLMPLGLDAPVLSHRLIHSSAIYFGEHDTISPYAGWRLPNLRIVDLEDTLITAFARRTVAHQLLVAQARLPRGMRLVEFDTYRPLSVQAALYQFYYGHLQTLHPDWSDDQLSVETQLYVSVPSDDPTRPSPHNTGGSVDVIAVWLPESYWDIIDQVDELILAGVGDWKQRYARQMYRAYLLNNVASPLPFGAPFDHGGESAGLAYFEQLASERSLTAHEERALISRRILAQAMQSAGFQAFPSEFWHWNSGNQMAAQSAGIPAAAYGAIGLSPANLAHENMRQQHWRNLCRLSSGEAWAPPPGLEEHYALVRETARALNPRHAWTLGRAEKIAPVAT